MNDRIWPLASFPVTGDKGLVRLAIVRRGNVKPQFMKVEFKRG